MHASFVRPSRWAIGQAVAATVLALVLGHVAWAQPAGDDAEPVQAGPSAVPSVTVTAPVLPFRQFDRIEITGSSIVRKEQTQALPVQVIRRQELQRRGHVTLTDAVQNLTNVFNGLELTQSGMNQGGFTSAALHGMPTGTLVLLNGKRLAPYGIQNMSGKEQASVDLEMLPLSAVERIEVLTDGASSLYGTDAIAGVINIITRTDMNGVEVSVDYSRPQGGAGQGRMARLNWGAGQLQRDGYSLRLSGEVDQYDRVQTSDRPGAAQGRVGFVQDGQSYAADSTRVSAFTSPAQIYSPNTTQKMLSYLYDGGRCTGQSLKYINYEGGCKVNVLPTLDIYPSRTGQRLHASGEVRLPNEATLYTELLYSQQKTDMAINNWPRISGRITNQPGAVGYADMVAHGMDPSYGFYFWQPDLPGLRQGFDKSLMRAAVGVKGVWDQWNYHASFYQSQSTTDQSSQVPDYGSLGIVPLQALANPWLLQALNDQNPLTGQLLDSRRWQLDASGRTTLTAAEWRASRPWFEIDGKDVLLGWGLEARNERVNTRFISDTSKPSFEGQRKNLAAHGELQVPVRPDWDVIGSLRTDQYSDVGNTTNGKLATRWALSTQWALRGALGTGFRAPSIGQVQQVQGGFSQDTVPLVSCSNALKAVVQNLKAADGLDVLCRDNNNLTVLTNGNPELRPEKSRQATLGLAFTPHRNLYISADYWRVEMTDTLQYESSAAVLADPARYSSSVVVNPTVVQLNGGLVTFHDMALLLKMRNIGQSVKSGVDFDISYRVPGDWGRWFMGAQATYILTSREKSAPNRIGSRTWRVIRRSAMWSRHAGARNGCWDCKKPMPTCN